LNLHGKIVSMVNVKVNGRNEQYNMGSDRVK
jgi:hypothetical protein